MILRLIHLSSIFLMNQKNPGSNEIVESVSNKHLGIIFGADLSVVSFPSSSSLADGRPDSGVLAIPESKPPRPRRAQTLLPTETQVVKWDEDAVHRPGSLQGRLHAGDRPDPRSVTAERTVKLVIHNQTVRNLKNLLCSTLRNKRSWR